MEFLVLAFAVLIIGGFLFVNHRTNTRELNSIRSALEEALSRNRLETNQTLQNFQSSTENRLDLVRKEVDTKLTETLSQSTKNLTHFSTKLEALQAATGQVISLSQGVKDLTKILETPKLRGSMGEFQLGEMLRQVLPEGVFEEQYLVDPKSKELVDAVIKFKEGILCIDSKFPLNNAKTILESDLSSPDYQTASKAFAQDVRTMADSIASKYLIPEKTLDFAFMFIPAESVYFEITRNATLQNYCLKKHVVPVSPNSLYAYLQAIAVGFRGLNIQNEAKKIAKGLQVLRADFEKIRVDFSKVGKHMKDAQTQYLNVDQRLEKMVGTIDKLGFGGSAETLEPGVNGEA